MSHRLRWLSTAALLLACFVGQWLVHSAIVESRSEPLRIALMLVPLLALAYWILTRSRHKPAGLLVVFAATGAVFGLESLERWGLAAAYGIPHAIAYLVLGWLFARTLARGQEPLVSRLARRVHGTLPPAMQIYTRRLTAAWCIFFAAQIAVSALLFVFAPLDTWSLFVNLLNFPMLALMFLGEYAYRVTRHRNFPHASLLKSVEAFTQDAAFSKNAEVR